MKIVLSKEDIEKIHGVTQIILENKAEAKLELQVNEKGQLEDLIIIE